MKRFSNATRRFLGALMSLALSLAMIGSASLVAEAADSEVSEVKVLGAELIEDFDEAGEISPYTMLTRCHIGVGGDSEGMHIDITTGTVGVASVIGIKDIRVQKKTWYGWWETVAVCDGAELKGRSLIGITITYPEAVKGATYKILCVHYADVTGYTECESDSGSFVYNFY